MAIKGYLNEISFVELLKVIGNNDGKLSIWNFIDKKQYDFFFYKQSVVYLNFCGNVVNSRESAKKVASELVADSKSYYAFQDDSFSSKHFSPVVSVAELLDFSVFEHSQYDENLLPNIDTKFETINKSDFVLQGALADFWRETVSMLHRGCSGRDICGALNLDEHSVRQNLYKLRTAGLIKPVRMFNPNNTLAKSKMMRQNLSNLANRIKANQHAQADSAVAVAESPVGQPELKRETAPAEIRQEAAPVEVRREVTPPPAAEVSPSYQPPPPEISKRPAPNDLLLPDFLSSENRPLTQPDSAFLFHESDNKDAALPEDFFVQTRSEQTIAAPPEPNRDSFGYEVHNLANEADEPVRQMDSSLFDAAPAAETKSQPVVKPTFKPEKTSLIKRMLGSLFRK